MPEVTVTSYTKAKIDQIVSLYVRTGSIVGDNLILGTASGTINAGVVKGAKGDPGTPGSTGPSGAIAGQMINYGGSGTPAGWLRCDGSSYVRATYPTLFSAIGTKYGFPDPSTFYVPDNRGVRMIGTPQVTTLNAWTTIAPWATDTSGAAGTFTSKVGRYYSYSAGLYTFITPGLYDLKLSLTWAVTTSAGRYFASFKRNNIVTASYEVAKSTTSSELNTDIFETINFGVGDTLKVDLWQSVKASHPLSTTYPPILEFYPRGIGDLIKT